MPSTFRDPSLLIVELRRMTADQSASIITIDGWSGVGKSTLARRLAGELDLCVFELDQFLNKNQGSCLQHIQSEKLRDAFAPPSHSRVLVEGICVIEILQSLRITPNIQVYVKKLSDTETWHSGLILDPDKTAEQVIQEEKEAMRRFATLQGKHGAEAADQPEVLEYEIIRYHYTFKPHETADLYYERLE